MQTEKIMHYLQALYSQLSFGPDLTLGTLTITPITSLGATHSDQFLSNLIALDVAYEKSCVSIREIGEMGSVQEILITNNCGSPLIILEGQGLEGAKQNRVVQKTVVVPSKTTITVPVNCVEKGRWNYKSAEFKPAKYSAGPSVKMRKASAMKISESMIQSEVWAEVAEMSHRFESYSSTDDMCEVLEQASIRNEFESHQLKQLIRNFEGYGYKVSGGPFEFIELFGLKEWAKSALEKSIVEWQLEAKNTSSNKNLLPLSILESDWIKRESVGDENQWLAVTHCTGMSAEYEGVILHTFIAPDDNKHRLRRRRTPIFDVE